MYLTYHLNPLISYSLNPSFCPGQSFPEPVIGTRYCRAVVITPLTHSLTHSLTVLLYIAVLL